MALNESGTTTIFNAPHFLLVQYNLGTIYALQMFNTIIYIFKNFGIVR